MIVFGLLAFSMAALAVIFLVWPLYFDRARPGPAREAINVALYRDRQAELQGERDSGALAPEQFAQAEVELQRDLLENAMPDAPSAQGGRYPRSALGMAVLVPVLAGGLYLWLGAPDFVEWESTAQQQQAGTMGSLDEAVTRLRARLADNPADLDGWLLLGRSLTVQQRYGAAADAYAQALNHTGERPDVLALYAEALAMAQGRVGGRPEELALRALEMDPDSAIALWLTGYGAEERGEYAEAVVRWERLIGLLPPDRPMAKRVQESLAAARQRLGVPAVAAKPVPATVGGDTRVSVSVGVNETLRSRIASGDVLFVYAQDPAGGRMPIAVVRRAATLPAQVVLDQSTVMMPGRRLGDFKALKILARVSRSGAATASSGDLYGEGRWTPGDKSVAIQIDRSVP